LYEEATWIFAFGPWIKQILQLTYSTAVDIPHEIDRQAAFYIIVLGEFLYGIIAGSPAGVGLNINLFRAVETLIIAFSLNWLYVNLDGSILNTHPLRRSVWTAFAWFLLHLPMAASLLLGGHMCSVSVGEDELKSGERWLLCGGLASGLFCLWIIGELHDSKDPPRTLILPKVCITVLYHRLFNPL
jgi:low temperature requirement protein LtrA